MKHFVALTSRQIGLLTLVGVLVAFILIAGSLSNLEFHSGDPFPGSAAATSDPVSVESSSEDLSIRPFAFLQGGLSVILLLLLLYLPFRLIRQVDLKLVLRWMLIVGLLAAVVLLLPAITPGITTYIPDESRGLPVPEPFDYETAALDQPPEFLNGLLILILVIGVGSLAYLYAKAWFQRPGIETVLQKEAEQAVRSLERGEDFNNVILRCYIHMSELLQKEEGIIRDRAMTVREFELVLRSKGFPADPVRNLSSMFEKVRYGKQQHLEEDEKRAMDSLNTLIEFCGR